MKEKYLLVDKIDHTKNIYKGISRKGIFNLSPVESHEFDLWLEASNAADADAEVDADTQESMFFNTLELAIQFLHKYKNIGRNTEVLCCIDVTNKDCINDNITKKEFLGYDTCDLHYYSIINFYKYSNYEGGKYPTSKENTLRILSLNYFSKKLNNNKLFSNYQDAYLFAEMELDIVRLYPKPNVNSLHLKDEYRIYKLYKVLVEPTQLGVE